MNINDIADKILVIPGILIGFTFHEYAHAAAADRLGDKTPKFQGRLTLNPFAHTDIIGFLMILLVGFGWAKPVETNPSAYKNRNRDDLIVSAAGPVANLFAAFIFSFLTVLMYKLSFNANFMPESILNIIFKILLQTVLINCMLFVFNLIPLPGLDGFHILRNLFPSLYYKISDTVYRYQFLILLIFIVSPISNYVVGIPYSFIYRSFIKIATYVVG